MRVMLLTLMLACTASAQSGEAFRVTIQLPKDGPLPRAYRVTLAAAPADRPDWLVSSFVTGGVRIVTEENDGRFTETWYGLDDAPVSITADGKGHRLLVLTPDGRIGAFPLQDGLPRGPLEPLMRVVTPSPPDDITISDDGSIWACWAEAGMVAKLNDTGGVAMTLGTGHQPVSGRYDTGVFYLPRRVTTWTNAHGRKLVLVVETDGPGRVSEWDAATGELVRQWFLSQQGQSGYCADPENRTSPHRCTSRDSRSIPTRRRGVSIVCGARAGPAISTRASVWSTA